MILILSDSPQECAAMLDDKRLSKMILACADVLCAVHHMKATKDIPLPFHKTVKTNDFINFALWCKANYRRLLEYAAACCDEWMYRFSEEAPAGCLIDFSVFRGFAGKFYTVKRHKMLEVLRWCLNNFPELSDGEATPFPLVMPDKYQVVLADGKQPYTYDVIESYRKYYRALLKKAGRKRCKECGGYGTFDIREKHPDPIFQCDFCNGKGYTKKAPTFTRHEIPSWLGDL
jgi:hypothetical protein